MAHEQDLEKMKERAHPWKSALENAFKSESKETLEFLFLTTYKHHVSDSAKGAPVAHEAEAKAFFQSWVSVKKACSKAKLNPVELAEAIYRFTNSDWAPVSATTGPGLDKVAGPKDYQTWATAVIEAGKKAKKAGLDPASAWFNQAASYQVHEPKDIVKTSLTAPQPRF